MNRQVPDLQHRRHGTWIDTRALASALRSMQRRRGHLTLGAQGPGNAAEPCARQATDLSGK